MKVQVIEKDGRPEYAVIPYAEYERLVEVAEMIEDVRDYDTVKEDLRSGREELVPADVADRLLNGENPVRVWRNHRRLAASASRRLLRPFPGRSLADRERQEKPFGRNAQSDCCGLERRY